MDTRDIVLDFGKHRGERIQRVPVNYLRWMVCNETQQSDAAKAELDRRGTHVPKIEVSGHAIDTASLRIRAIWHEHRGQDEGLHAWLCKEAWHAWEKRENDEAERVVYLGVKWIFERDGAYPILKTVMPARRNGSTDQ